MLNRKLLLSTVLLAVASGAIFCFYPAVQSLSSYIIYPVIYLHSLCIDRYRLHDDSDLQKAYDDLLSAHIQLQATTDYYDQIKELVDFKKRYTDQCIGIAQILERYTGDDEQYVLIDKGSRDGVHDRMVLVHKDMLVGRVHQVFPLYSKCLLITDERCKIGAYCANTKAEGVTKGCNNDPMTLEYVSHLSTMQERDLIISSGQGLIFPRGFGIARVTDFSKDDLLYHVSCRPLIDICRLRFCCLMEKS